MRTATVTLATAAILIAPTAATAQQPQSGVTVDTTIACPKDEDFQRYATLLLDDISAAILFKNDRHCVTLAAGTFVRIDHGSLQKDSNRVCIRPTGSYDCFWTFAGHVRSKDSK